MRLRNHISIAGLAIAASIWILLGAGDSGASTAPSWEVTQVVSVSSSEARGNSSSVGPAISGNGQFVAFTSAASNLVAGDNDPTDFSFQGEDVFVRDLSTGTTEMANLSDSDQQVFGQPARAPAITDDGRYVAFTSAGDITGNIQNEFIVHLYIRDRQADTTRVLDLAIGGGESTAGAYGGADISGDGNWAVFVSPGDDLIPNREELCDLAGPNECFDVFLVNVQTGATSLVSHGAAGQQLPDGISTAEPSISDNGQYTAYRSSSEGIVPENDNNNCESNLHIPRCDDIVLYNRLTHTNILVSKSSAGVQANNASYDPEISGNGRYVVYMSGATNLVPEEDVTACDGDDCTDIYLFDQQTSQTRLVSANASGAPANGYSGVPSVSSDGRYVTFQSTAANLVPGADLSCKEDSSQRDDTCQNIFVKDMVTGDVALVSAKSNGQAGDWNSYSPSISDDASRIAFDSGAQDFAPGDGNGNCYSFDIFNCLDVFVADVQTPPPARMFNVDMVSVNSDEQAANERSFQPSITGDGRYVAFHSQGSNLVTDDVDADAANASDVFVRDRVAGTTTLVSRDETGAAGDERSSSPDISDNLVVVFETSDDDIAGVPIPPSVHHVVVRDLMTGQNELVSVNSSGTPGTNGGGEAAISADGRYVAFTSSSANLVSGDIVQCNGLSCFDVFRHDRVTGVTEMVSVSSNGTPGNNHTLGQVDISADGMRVAFHSSASNLVGNDNVMACDLDFDSQKDDQCIDVFVHDFSTGFTTILTPGANGDSSQASISANGRYVAFQSSATNLAASDNNNVCDNDFDQQDDDNCIDVFVRDLQTNQTTLISRAIGGGTPNEGSFRPSISGDGRFVTYLTAATNIVPGYVCNAQPSGSLSGFCQDVYVFDRETEETKLVTVGIDGAAGNDSTLVAAISASGTVIAFHSLASNLVASDTVICGTDNCGDIFVAYPLGPAFRSDVNCDGLVDPVDALQLAVNQAGLDPDQEAGCPEIGSELAQPAASPAGSLLIFGDANCNIAADVSDAVDILAYYAYLDPHLPGSCPDFGPNRVNPGSTPKPTQTSAHTQTPTGTPNQSSSPGPTNSRTNTPIPTNTPVQTITPTPTSSPLPTATAPPTNSPTPSPSIAPGPTCIQHAPNAVPIPDNGVDILEVLFDDLPAINISELNFCLNIDHPFIGDLVVVLEKPDGQQIFLLFPPGQCSGDNLRVYFDDDASQAADSACDGIGNPDISGTYRPTEPLSNLGTSLGGDWKLIIQDAAIGDQGHLRGAYMWWTPE